MARLSLAVVLMGMGVCCTVAWGDAAAGRGPTTEAAGAPATRPAAATVSATELIWQLGDPDPLVRKRAARRLWSMGQPVAPRLREAASGGDPEVARQARSILRDLDYGLTPDAPRQVFELLDAYRTGNIAQKTRTILRLANQGAAGLRILLKLREDERDPDLHRAISQVLAPREHELAVVMSADGQDAQAERMLKESAPASAEAAQDYAALLLTDGKLPGVRRQLEAQPLTAQNAGLRAALARAAGDIPAARRAAQISGDNVLVIALLTDQQNWAGLARLVKAHPAQFEAAERLGYLCAYDRLAGDEKEFRKTARELADHARQSPQDYAFCAEDLFLNGLPEEAESVLLDHKDYLQASIYLTPRLQLKQAMALPALAAGQQPAQSLDVRARAVEAFHFAGQPAKAKEMMDQAAQANRLQHDFSVWASLIEDAQELDLPHKADEYCAAALGDNAARAPRAWLFQKLRLGDGAEAAQWWLFLRWQYKQENTAATLERLHSIFDDTIPKDELAQLADASRPYAHALAAPLRENWQAAVAATLARREMVDRGAKWFGELASTSSNSTLLIGAGDFEAARKNWPAAAEDYNRAWRHDRTRAAALFLYGWALGQSGHPHKGRALMELAHRLPLGSQAERHDLLEAIQRHKLTADAQREMDLILSATSPQSLERNDVLRQLGGQAAARGEYLAAADLYERAFLQNLSNTVSFGEPWANVMVPALIHKVRALGLIKAGQAAAAAKQARTMLDEVPGDADALIEVVGAFDKSGHKKEADALYREQTAVYRKLIAGYPQSGPAHNQLAWSQVMCHRELDDALKNARRAVELEPDSTASLDTLAEVYFARNDVPDAVAQMKRCIALEPHVPRHRLQLARFKAALHAN